MKKTLSLILALLFTVLSLSACGASDKYQYETFYGVVSFSEEMNRLLVYIPSYGDVEIPENEGCCNSFGGHTPEEDRSYQLKAGDLVAINFKYEKHWDEHGVAVMESYPARFDRRAECIEALAEDLALEKDESGYLFSFPTPESAGGATVGDTLCFLSYSGEDGSGSRTLHAEGEIIETSAETTTVRLALHGSVSDFLANYPEMAVEPSSDN